jgi:DNA-3-methyladenine glycosylase II
MLADPRRRAAARRHLARVDARLAPWIARVGRCTLAPHTAGSHLHYLARCIVFQQLSGKAAATIFGRVEGAAGAAGITADWLLHVPDATLRGAGLSAAKLAALRDLGRRVAREGLPVETVHDRDDAGVIETLTQVRGIGAWTAQMFLMFRLGRPDVLPVLDLGVQKGMQRVYGLRRLPTPERMEQLAAAWAPWRSVGSWYMWRALEVDGP